MSNLIKLNTFNDIRGSLTVIQDEIPFEIKRIYYIYNVKDNSQRGGHKHINTTQALIAINGSCNINIFNKDKVKIYELTDPYTCLIINPEDFHTMNNFSEQTILLVLASAKYDPNDYVYVK